MSTIKDTVEKENILQMPIIERMQCNNGGDNNDLDVDLNHYSIEVTERCNLRCKYCIYHEDGVGFREFGKKDISQDTLKKAIDLLKNSKSNDFVISFYGGEPLLRFDLIKWCIDYAKETLKGKELRFNMTTNATLNRILDLSYGYDTKINEDGLNLSGGERQRICIARGLVCNADVYLLDEITASIDEYNTNKLIEVLEQISENAIVIIISHDDLNFTKEIHLCQIAHNE